MEVNVQNGARPDPFLQARDAFATEFDLALPVRVFVQADPDERTWTSHPPGFHRLNISQSAASSGLARELVLHEFAHMYRHEEGHVSHHQTIEEALYLAAGGRRIPEHRLVQCYQIANHMKDIYADDLTVRVASGDKLVTFLESSLAELLEQAETNRVPLGAQRVTPATDPAIAVVNAAFATALVDRHELVAEQTHLHELAWLVAKTAPHIPYDQFQELFVSLATEPTTSKYRHALVDAFRTYLQTDRNR